MNFTLIKFVTKIYTVECCGTGIEKWESEVNVL